MDLETLRGEFRAQVRDLRTPPFWSDTRVNLFANEAQREAARRANLILDSTTAAICRIEYDANATVLDLDPRIIQIREVIIEGQSVPIDPVKMAYLARFVPAWRTATAGMPLCYIDDYGSHQIRPYPPPAAAGTLLLSVYREPLVDMEEDDDEPEVPARYQFKLIYHMKELALGDEDCDRFNPKGAAEAARKFSAEFGPPASARNEKWQSEQGAGFPDTLA